jgi:NAD+-dependent secondary alcohol dehydrogenase Adh1
VRAARLHGYDEGRLRMEDVPDPVTVGPFDVIVRIGGAGVCRTDLHIVEGQWEERSGVRLPYVPGHENAGWVHQIGVGVSGFQAGDPVIVHPQISCGACAACRAGDDMHCARAAFPGLDVDGGFAEYLKTSERSLVKLDRSLRPEAVAALADAGLTAYHAVKKAAPGLAPGSRAVVIGAGGLGHIGIQCLRALTSAEVIVIDRSEGALALAKQLGADHIVLADGRHVDRVMELTGGAGAEAIVDFVGEGSSLDDGIAMLRRAGTYYLVGYGGTLSVPAIHITSNEISIVGNVVGTYPDLMELMVLAARGSVALQTTIYPLEAANDALADLDAGRVRGRAILVPEGADS